MAEILRAGEGGSRSCRDLQGELRRLVLLRGRLFLMVLHTVSPVTYLLISLCRSTSKELRGRGDTHTIPYQPTSLTSQAPQRHLLPIRHHHRPARRLLRQRLQLRQVLGNGIIPELITHRRQKGQNRKNLGDTPYPENGIGVNLADARRVEPLQVGRGPVVRP